MAGFKALSRTPTTGRSFFPDASFIFLSFQSALPLQEEGQQEETNQEEADTVDMTTRILTANNGSEEILLEGDIVAPKSRNAMNCWYNSCLWKKDSSGKVVVPYVIGREFSRNERQTIEGGMRAFAGQTCIRFTPPRADQQRPQLLCQDQLGEHRPPHSAYNVYKHDTNNLNTPYDYSSIMHYARDAFAIA
ncbi:hypothetical protein GOODEAATRI_019145 [Goodea atripinnis]|uniref:Peptidase M12A domain-containing protein n=1 Tax=Goodea atripinnis TaxID=208336 RepID=A0ABV0MTD1_9TELE